MKLTISLPKGKRPFGPTLIAVFTVGLASLWVMGLYLFVVRSQLGQVVLLLTRLGFQLVPPALWIGAALIVSLWLVVLHRAWRIEVC